MTGDEGKNKILTNERTAHCLFEQSGTFKNEFKKLGFEAFDYDILNDFGETDYQIDLYKEIERAYQGEKSVFDNFKKSDIIMSFFPCTRFEAKVPLLFRGESYGQINWDDVKKLEYAMKLNREQYELYQLICKMFIVSIQRGLRMVVENPLTPPHYLTTYFPIKPSIIDKDRTERGDYYKKPTQFWFINTTVYNNLIFEPLEYVTTFTIAHAEKHDAQMGRKINRSLIHPQYANRFIREHILNPEGKL